MNLPSLRPFVALALVAVALGCQSRRTSSPPRTTPEAAESTPPQTPTPTPTRSREASPPSRLAFRPDKLDAIAQAASNHVAEGLLPGGVIWIEHRDQLHQLAFGQRSVEPVAEPMTPDTVFDAASLTKVIATTPAILHLVETGKLQLDDPIAKHIPAFGDHDKGALTVRHLLTHTSGLRPGLSLRDPWSGPAAALARACEEEVTDPAGTRFVYSDINFIVLGELVRAVSGQALDAYAAEHLFTPLGLQDTTFRPLDHQIARERIAPTERQPSGECLRGVVHDPTARRMDGVAGHAGLFTTAADLGRFARMLRGKGELDGRRILKAATIELMTSVQTAPGIPARGLGWDINSPYAGPRGSHFPVGSYGHTGWTGTSLWIDPGTQTTVILMSNRNHPTEAGDVRSLRRILGTLAAEALPDVTWPKPVTRLERPLEPETSQGAAGPADAPVRQGIDVLVRDGFKPLQNLKVGLITNHTGRDRERRPTIDLLHAAPGVKLVALFSPEHGIRGLLDEKVSDGRDEQTGLPVYSLYGDRRAPTAEQLASVDVLVFDIQDIGCRFYTYISTLGNCLEAAARAGKQFVVLDRVNPVNGLTVEGPILTGTRSFIAWHEIPLRHGLTAGELAGLFNAERRLGAQLTVIRCEGWHRADWFDATGLPWTNPSPNMRSLTEATLYPGVGLLEFCAVSVGRGTGTPFELLGAPYVDDRRFAAELNAVGLPGVRFIPVRFTPTASVFKGQECGGVQLLVTDREAFRAADLGMAAASILHRLYPDQLKLDKAAALLGDAATLDALRSGQPLAAVRATRDRDVAKFQQQRQAYLLY